MSTLKRNLVPFAAYLLCAFFVLKDPYRLAESEFSSGRVTGRLLELDAFGFFFFVGAALLALLLPRIASVVAVSACLLCLPLRLYFIAPGLYRQFFRGEWSGPARAYFVADKWAIQTMVGVALAMSAALYHRHFQRSKLDASDRKNSSPNASGL